VAGDPRNGRAEAGPSSSVGEWSNAWLALFCMVCFPRYFDKRDRGTRKRREEEGPDLSRPLRASTKIVHGTDPLLRSHAHLPNALEEETAEVVPMTRIMLAPDDVAYYNREWYR
jgi:hypothetical protein